MDFQATYSVTCFAVEVLGELKLFRAATMKHLQAVRAGLRGYRGVEVECHSLNLTREHEQGHRNLSTCEPERTVIR